MDEFKLYIDVPMKDIKLEQRGDAYRIHFRNNGAVRLLGKLIDDLIIYAKYRNR